MKYIYQNYFALTYNKMSVFCAYNCLWKQTFVDVGNEGMISHFYRQEIKCRVQGGLLFHNPSNMKLTVKYL